MKRPKWTDKTVGPLSAPALRYAAKALRIDARLCRKEGLIEQAVGIEFVAHSLDAVASGQTWAQAFNWPVVNTKKKGV